MLIIEMLLMSLEESMLQNYRLKICVNFNDKTYTDTITDKFLLDKINSFCTLCHNKQVLYGYFQKSNYNDHYSIVLVCSPDINVVYLKDLYYQQLATIVTKVTIVTKDDYQMVDNNLQVFGYQLKNQETVTYISEKTRLNYSYYDFIWYSLPTSFIQVNKYAGTYIHNLVQELICKDIKHFCGIGGEMGIYAKAFSINDATCLTNSQDIYDDCILNLDSCKFHLVDYDTVNLSQYMSNLDQVLVINISRNGLRGLARQIVELDFKQIIYIGCSDKAVRHDLDILKKRYVIDKMYINGEYQSYVISLIPQKID